MRNAYGQRMRLSANDVVCAHVSESLMKADPAVDRRTLAIAVNARNRCGLDPMLVGNIITTLNLEVRRGEAASSIAERIRHNVDHFVDEHCDMRITKSSWTPPAHGGAPAVYPPPSIRPSGTRLSRTGAASAFTASNSNKPSRPTSRR